MAVVDIRTGMPLTLTRREAVRGGLAAILATGCAPALMGFANASVGRGMMRNVGARNAVNNSKTKSLIPYLFFNVGCVKLLGKAPSDGSIEIDVMKTSSNMGTYYYGSGGYGGQFAWNHNYYNGMFMLNEHTVIRMKNGTNHSYVNGRYFNNSDTWNMTDYFCFGTFSIYGNADIKNIRLYRVSFFDPEDNLIENLIPYDLGMVSTISWKTMTPIGNVSYGEEEPIS